MIEIFVALLLTLGFTLGLLMMSYFTKWIDPEGSEKDEPASKNFIKPDVISSGKVRCPDCGDRGWLYDKDGQRTGTCPCHY